MNVGTMEDSRSQTIGIGSRIRVEDGAFGTVLYVGPVRGTGGVWYGVEWDSPERGKHDGEYDGVKYFHAKPHSATFIRAKKVSPSTTFFYELSNRYGLQMVGNAGVSEVQLYVGDGLGQITKVEMVGAEKVNLQQSKFENLQIVVLDDARIHGLEEDVDLEKIIPNVTELNLSKNLISDWREMARIAGQLRRLKVLDLSDNRLICPDSPESLAENFRSLRTLFVNRMNIDFDTLLEWSKMWPAIHELHMCFNGVTELTHPGQNYLKDLKLLNLEGNLLKSWEEVLKLRNLLHLDTLILNDTGLKYIELKLSESEGFTSLRKLSICDNLIESWSSINELNQLRLTDLKLTGNPLFNSDTWENIRDLVAAKIRSLKYLNRTEITAAERRGAEICYLKRFGEDWLAACGDLESDVKTPNVAFLDNHPRFQELVDKYGAPEVTEMKRASQGLKGDLISVCLQRPDKAVDKNLPLTMTVQKLKTLSGRLFKLDPSSLSLYYVSQSRRFLLDNDLRDLNFYSVVSGDVIEVTS